jgi:hypothetical protein
MPTSGRARQSADAKPIETTVCELVTHSKRFVGREVRIRAEFLSDDFEHSVLIDQKCKTGIVPFIADQAADHDDIKEFDRALAKGTPGTRDKRIFATFTGRFLCKPNCTAIGGRILEIEQIKDLEVTNLKPKGH